MVTTNGSVSTRISAYIVQAVDHIVHGLDRSLTIVKQSHIEGMSEQICLFICRHLVVCHHAVICRHGAVCRHAAIASFLIRYTGSDDKTQLN